MRLRLGVMVLGLIGCLSFPGWSVTWADPSFELTARYILDIVKAFRTAYVLHVVEHTRAGGLSPREDWESVTEIAQVLMTSAVPPLTT